MKDVINELPPVAPAAFFTVTHSVTAEMTALPDLSDLLVEEPYARLSLAWSPRGLSIEVKVRGRFSENAFPRYRDGDSIELFIETRRLGTTAVHKFCHHFVFLPDESGLEMTRLRADEERPLADGLSCDISQSARSSLIDITLPETALYGYAPSEFSTIGFAYRINRHEGEGSHFPISPRDVILENHPTLWGNLELS